MLVAELCPTLCDPNFVRLSHHKGPHIVIFHLSEMSRIGKSVCVLSHSVVSYSVTPWTVARQASLSMGIFQARILEWVAMPSSRGSSQPRPGFDPWVEMILWRSEWQPTPVFLPWRIPWTEEPGGL